MATLNYFNQEEVLTSYLETLLWSEFIDENTIYDFCDESKQKAKLEIALFMEEINKSKKAIKEANRYTAESLGHNFLLSRNHHGAGFFDENNDTLQSLSNKFAECNAYVGDDNKIYID